MYKVIASKNGRLTVYGLEGAGKRIEDITTNRQGLELLAKKCCRANLSPCHLHDVVEDWLVLEYAD